MDINGVMRLYCESWLGGVKAAEMRIPVTWTTGLAVFKILRWGSTLYFYANGSLLWKVKNFISTLAYFQMYSENLTENYDVDIAKIEWFNYRSFAVFQNQPVHNTVIVSDSRMRGNVPASRDEQWQEAAYEGLVDATVVANGIITSTDAYRYYYVAGMKAINSVQSDIEMSLVNDPQIFTPDGETKGLGGGF